MAYATDSTTGRSFEIDPESVVRMWKPDDDTTAIMLDTDLVLVDESMKTMWARFGGDAVIQFMDNPSERYEVCVAVRHIAALTKAFEDSDGDDPTLVHLANGDTVPVTESIRTLSARLSSAGIRMVDIDIVDTRRPACVAPGHVLIVGEPSIRLRAEERSDVYVRGGFDFTCADAPRLLRGRIEEAKAAGAVREEPSNPAP